MRELHSNDELHAALRRDNVELVDTAFNPESIKQEPPGSEDAVADSQDEHCLKAEADHTR